MPTQRQTPSSSPSFKVFYSLKFFEIALKGWAICVKIIFLFFDSFEFKRDSVIDCDEWLLLCDIVEKFAFSSQLCMLLRFYFGFVSTMMLLSTWLVSFVVFDVNLIIGNNELDDSSLFLERMSKVDLRDVRYPPLSQLKLKIMKLKISLE